MTDQEEWNITLAWCQAKLPGFEVRYKDETWHQKLISTLMFFNKEYAEYTTTWDDKIYFPSREYVESKWPHKTLQHEFIHAWDGRTLWGLLKKNIPYLSKLCWVIFAIVYLIPAPFPLPSPGRMWAEMRAYRRSVELRPNYDQAKLIEKYVGQFAGPAYYWMWPFRKHVTKMLTDKPSPYKAEMDAIFD